MNFIESPAEVIGVALNSLGYSMNTTSDKELNAARDLLLKVRPHVNTINEVYLDDFIAGKIDLGITYSGDGIRIRDARKAAERHQSRRAPGPLGDLDRQLGDLRLRRPIPSPRTPGSTTCSTPAVNAREMEYVQYEVGTPASFPLVGATAKDPLVVFGAADPEQLRDPLHHPGRPEQAHGHLGRVPRSLSGYGRE